MKDTIYLLCTKDGVSKMLKTEPRFQPGDVCVIVSVEVPNEAFEPMIARAHVTVPNEMVVKPAVYVSVEGEGQ